MAFNFFIASCKTVSGIRIVSNFNVDTAIFAISVHIFQLIHQLVDVASNTFSSAALFIGVVSYWINPNNLATRGVLLYLEMSPILFTRPGYAIWTSFDSFDCANTINKAKYFKLPLTYLEVSSKNQKKAEEKTTWRSADLETSLNQINEWTNEKLGIPWAPDRAI